MMGAEGEAPAAAAGDQTTSIPQQPPQPPPLVAFRCHSCAMHQLCNYYGTQPPFAPAVRLPSAFYVMKNPFAPPPNAQRPSAEYYLLLGAQCARCDRQVCRASGCSIFYGQTTCLTCAERSLASYPLEIRTKINRALSERVA